MEDGGLYFEVGALPQFFIVSNHNTHGGNQSQWMTTGMRRAMVTFIFNRHNSCSRGVRLSEVTTDCNTLIFSIK